VRKSGKTAFAIRKRFLRARKEGDLPSDADSGDLARYLITVWAGLGYQAANGASRDQMARVAAMALQALSY
jgi:hypothetical protein